jgi:hypothetical protein
MTALPSTDIASAPSEIARPKLDQPMGIKTILIFFAIMALGLFFSAYSIHKDLLRPGRPSPATCLSFCSPWRCSSRSASNSSTVSTLQL